MDDSIPRTVSILKKLAIFKTKIFIRAILKTTRKEEENCYFKANGDHKSKSYPAGSDDHLEKCDSKDNGAYYALCGYASTMGFRDHD